REVLGGLHQAWLRGIVVRIGCDAAIPRQPLTPRHPLQTDASQARQPSPERTWAARLCHIGHSLRIDRYVHPLTCLNHVYSTKSKKKVPARQTHALDTLKEPEYLPVSIWILGVTPHIILVLSYVNLILCSSFKRTL